MTTVTAQQPVDHQSPRWSLRVALLLAGSIVLLVIMSVFATRSIITLSDRADWVAHTERVRFEASRVRRLLTDVENAGRGYVLTGDTQFLEPYRAAVSTIDADISNLKQLVGDNPSQAPLAERLQILAGEELASTARDIAAVDAGHIEQARVRAAAEEGKRTMDAVAQAAARMTAEEDRLLEVRRDEGVKARIAAMLAMWAAGALAIFLLCFVVWMTLRDRKRVQRVHRVAEMKLLESEERFRAAVDATQGVLWTNTAEGEMRGEQAGWAKLTGQSFEEYQGFGWATAVHPEDAQPTIDAWLEAVRERRPFIFEHRVRRRDDQWRKFSVRAIPLFDDAKAIRQWVGVHTDITEQRQAELALKEASVRKDVFLATLSHELRNPLAPIRTSARLLESGKLDAPEMTRSFAIISRQVRHMASLLDDLLDVSRITRGILILKNEPVLLLSILEGAVEAARPSIDAKRHRLDIEWPSETIELDADPVRLTQVATNLLCNAAKYTDPEGHITFGAKLHAHNLSIYVRDTGIGIAPEMLSHVFEMFAQVHTDPERTEGGLGIGLALVKGLVELHGGRVEVRSAGLDRGSEFIVTLPPSVLNVLPTPLSYPSAAELTSSRRRRIVLADDNRDGAESLGMLLEFSGHEVHLAHTGTDALRLSEEHRPQVCILDIGMPGLNGYEVADRIRREAWGAHMMLIAVTGYGQQDDKAKAQSTGFDHHLTKPIDPDALEAIINAG